MKKNAIARVKNLNYEEFLNRHLACNFPVVVTGHSGIAKTSLKWGFEYIASTHDDHNIRVEHYANDDYRPPYVYREMSLPEYLNIVRDKDEKKKYYLAEMPLNEVLPNIAHEAPPPDFLAGPGVKLDAKVFIGVDTYSAPHYHPSPREALLMQMTGKKKIILCPLREYRSLYPYDWFSGKANFSRVKFRPTLENDGCESVKNLSSLAAGKDRFQYPDIANANILECTLKAGEVLFIPQGWFHFAYGINESISVTFFFKGSWKHAPFLFVVRESLIRNYGILSRCLNWIFHYFRK